MPIETTRHIFLQVARNLFSRFGFRKTSMDEIARKARKAKGSLYYYFASKEELFTEILLKEIQDLKDLFYQCIEAENIPYLLRLENYLNQRIKYLLNSASYQEAVRADMFERLDFVDHIRQEFSTWEEKMIASLMEKALEQGEIGKEQDIFTLTKTLMYLMRCTETYLFTQPDPSELEILTNHVFRVFLNGIVKTT